MKILRSHKGFTLAELCVVMAVAAIVGTMVTTFIVYATGQHTKILTDSKKVTETAKVQQAVDAWIKKYDSANYTITSPGNFLVAKNTAGVQIGKISFNTADKKLQSDAATMQIDAFENINTITFSALSGKNAVKVIVNYGNDETQDLIFPLFSNVTRSRRVENRS